MSIYAKLTQIQNGMRVTKDKRNDFGKYTYRSAEMIYEAAKPLCLEHGVTLSMSDEVIQIGERYYIKATATLTDGTETISKSAYAREAEQMKGQSDPQVSGSTSSYARKYALQGLFLLDDNKDPDEVENVPDGKPNGLMSNVLEKIEYLNDPKLLPGILKAYKKDNLNKFADGELKKLSEQLDVKIVLMEEGK